MSFPDWVPFRELTHISIHMQADVWTGNASVGTKGFGIGSRIYMDLTELEVLRDQVLCA